MGGSGNWYRYGTKNTTGGLKTIDVNWLNRKGYLQPDQWFSMRWTRNGEPCGNISCRYEQDLLILDYKFRQGDEEWQEITEHVSITWTPCNYGGQRPWFICPGAHCGRRVGKLYNGGKYFLCRHCYDLTYETRREDRAGRLMLKAQNIQRRLGGKAGSGYSFPDKPKGMHWDTYSRLYLDYRRFDAISWRATAEKFHLLENIERKPYKKGRRRA